ncbi:MAG: methionine synthase [Clostridia bacterium]|nr:methionine synthase [Clostridia bacterium]
MIKGLDENEILRYMGYPSGYKPDNNLRKSVKEKSEILLKTATPKSVYSGFDIECTENGIALIGSDIILLGNSIKEHLKFSKKCVIMAATLGVEADKLIRKAQISSVSDALIFDACATAYIEAVCDETEIEIKEKFGSGNFRFSPGYGDFPIALQKNILALLSAEKKIGLCANSSDMLTPSKSVTAVIGIVNECVMRTNKCELCPNKERCAFSRYEK